MTEITYNLIVRVVGMNNKKMYEKADRIKVSTFEEALFKCKSIRNKDSDTPYIIEVETGHIEDEIKFKYSNFWIVGETPIVIISNLSARSKDKNGKDLTTWRTPVLKVMGDNCIFENFEVSNIAGNPEQNGQQVALAVYGNNNLFFNCKMSSTQDTLFVGPLPDDLITRYNSFLPDDERLIEGNLRNVFSHCKIEGTIDFVFGAGQALFTRCELVSLETDKQTYVTAPAHSLKDSVGFVFFDCKFTSTGSDQSVYLSRPWRDYGKCVFIYCYYGNHIKDEGFLNWKGTSRNWSARYEEYPFVNGRVPWVKDTRNKKIPDRYVEMIKEAE